MMRSQMAVGVQPLTQMPYCASSMAVEQTKWIKPLFAVQEPMLPGCPYQAAVNRIQTILPLLWRSIMAWATYLV